MKQTIDPSDREDLSVYKLMIGLIVPRPIAWVGTRSQAGVNNLAPFSFFNAVAASPPTVLFSTIRPHGRRKDTLVNVSDSGVFTLSMVGEDLVDAMNLTAGTYEPDVDEFELADLSITEGEAVAAPMVTEAKANLECRVTQILDIGGEAPMASSLVIGEIVKFHIDADVLDGGRVDQKVLKAIGRMGGPTYTRTRDLFSVTRPE